MKSEQNNYLNYIMGNMTKAFEKKIILKNQKNATTPKKSGDEKSNKKND